jgi:hypothetical protein
MRSNTVTVCIQNELRHLVAAGVMCAGAGYRELCVPVLGTGNRVCRCCTGAGNRESRVPVLYRCWEQGITCAGEHRTDHEAPGVEYRYSSTLSLISALDGVSGQCHAPAALLPETPGTHFIEPG